jgi:hypothetical protein
VTMKNVVFWLVKPCGSCKKRRFGGTYHLHLLGDRIGELGTTLEQTSNMMLGAIRSSETSVLTRAKRRNNPEDAVLPDRQIGSPRNSVVG